LLGEPTFFPHATEAVWTLTEDRSVYVVEHADGAGNSAVTIFLDDLDAHVAAIAARGLEPDERLTYSNGVREALYRDPDGNEPGFAGAPSNQHRDRAGDADRHQDDRTATHAGRRQARVRRRRGYRLDVSRQEIRWQRRKRG
jgi:hypothetical protein